MQLLPAIIPGDDYLLTFTFENDDGTPEDQSGNSIRLVVKASSTATAVLFDEVFNAESPDQEAGLIRAPIPHSVTSTFPRNSTVTMQGRRTTQSGERESPLPPVQVQVLKEAIPA